MYVFLSSKINGKLMLRRYTPVNSNYDVGCLKFLIQAYLPCKCFPKGGKMSQYLDAPKLEITLISVFLFGSSSTLLIGTS